jgi:hypothetical protein
MGEGFLTVGSDVTTVLVVSSPAQQKMELDGRGSDRLYITLREA